MGNNIDPLAPVLNRSIREVDPGTWDELEAIKDPRAQLIAAAEVARKGWQGEDEMEELLHRRRVAWGILHQKYGVPKAECIRMTEGLGGRRDHRVVSTALADLDETKLPGWSWDDQAQEVVWRDKSDEERAWAEAEAKTAHAEIYRRKAPAEVAREFMRVRIIEFASGVHGERVKDAELGRWCGVSGVRILQIRTGTTGKKPKEPRESAGRKGRPRRHRQKAAA